MKKNDERQVCPPDTQCMSGFIGTILALVISVLAWVQKLSYIPSFAKQDCPDFCEFTRTIEKLKEITVQAEAMSKSVSPSKNNKKKGEEDCICIQDQVSDDERDNVQLLYGENPKAKQSDSCTKCCQKVVSEIDRISSETQTLPAQLQDGTTQPTEGSLSEKGTQDTKEVKVGIAQSTDVECVCDHTQVSDTSLPDASHKQNKKSYLASKQSRTSEEEIAEVYRTLVSEDTYEAEYDEEDVNYFDMVCSEQYRPCRQDMSPYYQYPLQGRQPQQVRQPTPYPKREPIPTRQPRPPASYDPSYKQTYECGRDGGGSPIYCYPSQTRPKPTQSFPRPFPVSYSPYPRQARPQKLPQKHYVPPQYYLPQQYSSRSPSPPSSPKRSTSPVRVCEPECPTSKHALRNRTPPVPVSPPRQRGSSPVRECEPECIGSKHSLKYRSRERECELDCPGSKHSLKGKRRSPTMRECELECPGSKHTMRRAEEENVDCIPQCPGYIQKYPRDDCIPECPGYVHGRRPQRSPKRECELECPGSRHLMKNKSPPPSGGAPILKNDEDLLPQSNGYEKMPPPKDQCIPDCIRYKPREEEKLLRKECLEDCPGVQFQPAAADVQRSKKSAPRKNGKRIAKPNQKQNGAQSNDDEDQKP